MTNTRYLSGTRTAILADLASNGFHFTDEDGNTRIPNSFDQTSNGTDGAIYLGRVPIPTSELDEDGNPITEPSPDFCANVTACEGLEFATERDAPTTPYNVFA